MIAIEITKYCISIGSIFKCVKVEVRLSLYVRCKILIHLPSNILPHCQLLFILISPIFFSLSARLFFKDLRSGHVGRK